MKIKYLAGFFCVAICLSNAYSAATIEKNTYSADFIKKIVALAQEGQHTFCRKGMGSYTLSIRSHNGSRCKDEARASIARMVCKDFKDFEGSHCAKEANKLGINNAQSASAYLENFAHETSTSPEYICRIITEILPSTERACHDLVVAFKKSISKPAQTREDTKPTQELAVQCHNERVACLRDSQNLHEENLKDAEGEDAVSYLKADLFEGNMLCYDRYDRCINPNKK